MHVQHLGIAASSAFTFSGNFAFLGFNLIDNRQIHYKNHGTLNETNLNSGKRGNL